MANCNFVSISWNSPCTATRSIRSAMKLIRRPVSDSVHDDDTHANLSSLRRRIEASLVKRELLSAELATITHRRRAEPPGHRVDDTEQLSVGITTGEVSTDLLYPVAPFEEAVTALTDRTHGFGLRRG